MGDWTLKGFAKPKGGAYGVKSVPPSRVATDPKPRRDGLCVCGCKKKRTRVAIRHEDPFASTVCCRTWYGVEQ